jgi:hypothetical protein
VFVRRYTFWLWAAVTFQLITAVFHSLSFIVTPELNNETERQIHELITTYRSDLGAGFNPTFADLFTALSSCFTFVCLLGGLTLGYLLRKKVPCDILKGVTLINVIVFGCLFVVMSFLTFLPPIICTGLIFATLLIAYILLRIERASI